MKRRIIKKYASNDDVWWNHFIDEIFEVVTYDRNNYRIVALELDRIWKRIPTCRKYDKFLLDKQYCRAIKPKRSIRIVRKL